MDRSNSMVTMMARSSHQQTPSCPRCLHCCTPSHTHRQRPTITILTTTIMLVLCGNLLRFHPFVVVCSHKGGQQSKSTTQNTDHDDYRSRNDHGSSIVQVETPTLLPSSTTMNNETNASALFINATTTTTNKEDVIIDSFFFIHQPKTGSSLLTLLRNRLSACQFKDFTCLGQLGGGFPARMSRDGKDHFPFPTSMLTNLSSAEAKVENTCKGALDNCGFGAHFHCMYRTCKDRPNKVTMFREPHRWFKSALEWEWLNYVTREKKVPLPLPTQMLYMTDEQSNVSRAIEIIQEDYLFFGITDYWETTVCLFHCELGGEAFESEFRNDRRGDNALLMTPDDVATNHPTPNDLVPNRTAYVEDHYRMDLELYDRLLVVFWERANKCGCRTDKK